MKLYKLYEEAARVAKMIEGTNLEIYECIKTFGTVCDCMPDLLESCIKTFRYEFAIAVVEGKPVFKGDIIYYIPNGGEQLVGDYTSIEDGKWSWTPPKSKTVMVELLREDAEWFVVNSINLYTRRLAISCHKALETSK
ncbi:MAG: hypothetical protein LUQ18_01200 [Methylococcaceae bacterium]|nr:hypothetical protein [Methylococcaceae bacterium]